jgi:hypothetical protein
VLVWTFCSRCLCMSTRTVSAHVISWIQAWFVRAEAMVLRFLEAADTTLTRSGARSAIWALLNQASDHKRKRSPLPSLSSTEASKSAVVKASDLHGNEVQAHPRFVLRSHIQQTRSATPNNRMSNMPRPPSRKGHWTRLQETRVLPFWIVSIPIHRNTLMIL